MRSLSLTDTAFIGRTISSSFTPDILIRGDNINGLNNVGLTVGYGNQLATVTNLGSLGGTMATARVATGYVYMSSATTLGILTGNNSDDAYITLPAASAGPIAYGWRMWNDVPFGSFVHHSILGPAALTNGITCYNNAISWAVHGYPRDTSFTDGTYKVIIFAWDGSTFWVEIDGVRGDDLPIVTQPGLFEVLGGQTPRCIIGAFARTTYDQVDALRTYMEDYVL